MRETKIREPTSRDYIVWGMLKATLFLTKLPDLSIKKIKMECFTTDNIFNILYLVKCEGWGE